MQSRDVRTPGKKIEQLPPHTGFAPDYSLLNEKTDSKKEHPVQKTPETVGATETEKTSETLAILETEEIESTIESLKKKLRFSKKKKTVIPTVKDEIAIRVEKIMEEGIVDAFREMTPVQQQEFKIKGEETAWKIRALLKQAHIKVKEIFKLLVEWLRMLPGVNKFFIEQEAKIKADKIISLKKHQYFD